MFFILNSENFESLIQYIAKYYQFLLNNLTVYFEYSPLEKNKLRNLEQQNSTIFY